MEAALQAGEAALRRDPRASPYGFLAGGAFVHEGTEVFMWFDSPQEIVTHLLDVEPLLLPSLAEGADIEAYRDRIRAPLEQLQMQGFSDAARLAFNEAAEGCMHIDWWGEFDELRAGETAASRELLSWFRDPAIQDTGPVAPLADSEMEAFVRFLQAW
ncbi:MAG: hypothetical protein RI988_1413 [Pseudomonadota bacterium]|jgi:hypothetical protein